MTAAVRLRTLLRTCRLRAAARVAAFAALALLPSATLAWRLGGTLALLATLLAGLGLGGLAAWRAARRIGPRWLARRLDAADPRMEDSAALLFAREHELSALARLQRARLQRRIEAQAPPDLRPPWPRRALLAGSAVAAAITALVALWPVAMPAPESRPVQATLGGTDAPARTRLLSQRLDIVPPAYTRLPARREQTLDARVPEGATLRWTLRFAPQPSAVALRFHDGRTLALTREDDAWTGHLRIARPSLYRIVPDGAPPLQPDRLHRLDVVADQPPNLRTIAPQDTLTLYRAGQRVWSLVFEADDDHGLAATATLHLTLAQGSGDQVSFHSRTLTVAGQGTATHRRYAHTLELAPLALAPGDDLVVQLSVSDNRVGRPHTVRSASYLLRRPQDTGEEAGGLDGLVRQALPAYFRSQRQIIMDAEALIAQRRRLDADAFLARSDAIGVDQRVLRLRYGQFLGEESEGAPRRLLPTADAEAEDATHADDHAQADTHAHAPSPPATPAFGRPEDVLENYGHTHDDSEAATLFDPETRATLKAALDRMWDSERELRSGHPEQALPHAYKALDLIKQVQQAGRIYLARTGPELPPIDQSRRLTGKREGIAPGRDPLVAAAIAAPAPVVALWQTLGDAPGVAVAPADLDAAERWLRANEHRLPEALDAIAALDTVRREPACAACRRELRARLWPILPRPPAAPTPRTALDRAGRAYLDALDAPDSGAVR